jgi:hypothetical protein
LLNVSDTAEEKRVRCPSCGNVFLPEWTFDPEIFFMENGMPKERAWVGIIMDLIESSLNEWDLSNVADWAVSILEFNYSPTLLASSVGLKKEGKRFCTLGQCKGFSLFQSMLENGNGVSEPVIQGMAFEICRIVEPNWDELIKQRWD